MHIIKTDTEYFISKLAPKYHYEKYELPALIEEIKFIKEMLGEYGRDLQFPRVRAPVRRDGTWLPGFALAVIRAPCSPSIELQGYSAIPKD